MKSGRGLFVLGVAVLATRLSLTGCDDADSHIYTGEPYDPTLGCLEPLTSVDIVVGPEPMNPCGPVCILSLPEDGGQTAFISTMCAPYPLYPYQTDASTNPLCVAALNAFARDALCEDGGVVYPNGEDSGVDAGTGADAGVTGDAADAGPSAQDAGAPSDSGGEAAQD